MSFMEYANVSLTCSFAVIIIFMIRALAKSSLHAGVLRLIWLSVAFRLAIPLQAKLLIHKPSDVPIQSIRTGKGSLQLVFADRTLTAIWLIGAVLFFSFHIVCYILFCINMKGKVLQAQSLRLEYPILKEVEASKIKIVRANAPSPSLIGFLKPCIVLPQKTYADRELNLIIAHEFCHYKSHDTWLKLLLLIANALNWFNPMIYFMCRRADSDLESACDARVLRRMPADERKVYAYAILSTVESSRNALSPHFFSYKKEMHNRFVRILHNQSRMRNSVPLLLIVIGILAHSAISVLAYPTAKTVPVTNERTKPEWSNTMPMEDRSMEDAANKETGEKESPVLPVSPDDVLNLRMPDVEAAPVGILTKTDAPVSAPISGEVVKAGYNTHSAGGLEVEIVGESGRAVLRHLGEIDVHEGDIVEQGAMVGKAGQTGAASQIMCSFEWIPFTKVLQEAIDDRTDS